jgi:hypothetical protein
VTVTAETRAKPIRGAQRIALVVDLASGELTHEALAAKYGRTKQAIHEFSAYNSAEIQAQRDTLAEAVADELRGVLIAHKANRITLLDQYHRDCQERTWRPPPIRESAGSCGHRRPRCCTRRLKRGAN